MIYEILSIFVTVGLIVQSTEVFTTYRCVQSQDGIEYTEKINMFCDNNYCIELYKYEHDCIQGCAGTCMEQRHSSRKPFDKLHIYRYNNSPPKYNSTNFTIRLMTLDMPSQIRHYDKALEQIGRINLAAGDMVYASFSNFGGKISKICGTYAVISDIDYVLYEFPQHEAVQLLSCIIQQVHDNFRLKPGDTN